MRVVVDRDRCDLHGQCTIVAPTVFELSVENELVYVPEVDESLRTVVEEACDVCPTQAISIVE